MNLLDTAQIAQLLNVTREHVTDKLTKAPDFPAPAVNLSRKMRRWDEGEVIAWLTGVRRSPRPSSGSTSPVALADPCAR